MATTSTPTSSTTASQAVRQLVVFSLHGEHYALAITSVREIIRYRPPRPIGSTNSLLQGVISLRGHIVPVCDLSSRLGNVLEIRDGSRILIVETSEAVFGLIVDTVDEVLLVPTDQIEPMPVAENGLGDQIATIDERLIILIDAEQNLAGVLVTPPLHICTARPAAGHSQSHAMIDTAPVSSE